MRFRLSGWVRPHTLKLYASGPVNKSTNVGKRAGGSAKVFKQYSREVQRQRHLSYTQENVGSSPTGSTKFMIEYFENPCPFCGLELSFDTVTRFFRCSGKHLFSRFPKATVLKTLPMAVTCIGCSRTFNPRDSQAEECDVFCCRFCELKRRENE